MGVDLKLLPVTELRHNSAYSHTVLELDRDYDLFDRIKEIEEKQVVPKSFNTYVCREGDIEETHYGNTQHDSYGDRVKMVRVRDLVCAFYSFAFKGVLSTRNTAIYEYINSLDENDDIALFWG